MLLNEFNEQVDRLKTVYGEKAFPEERVKVFWDMFKGENKTVFERSISNIIAKSYTAPPADKIRIAVTELREKLIQKNRQEYNWDCSWCGTSGFVIVVSQDDPLKEGCMKCKCEFADLFARARLEVYDPEKILNIHCKFWSDTASISGPVKLYHDPDPEKAKTLANEYAPKISEIIKRFGRPLPYDPTKTISEEL